MVPYIGKRLTGDISAVEIQKSAGLHHACVGNKAEPGAAQASTGHGVQSMGLKRNGFAVCFGPLPQNPVIMRRTRGFELESGFVPLVIKPVKGGFVFFRADFLVNNVFSPACGNEQKNMQSHGPKVFGQFQNGWNLIVVELGNGGVDLKFNAGFFGGLNTVHGRIIGAGNPSKAVMTLTGGPVKADTDALDAGSRHFGRVFVVHQGAVWGHDHAQALVCAVFCDVENIRPQQGLSAGQDDNGLTHLPDLVQEPERGRSIKLAAVWPHGGGGPAMGAVQIAVPGGFPGHQSQFGVFLVCGILMGMTFGMHLVRMCQNNSFLYLATSSIRRIL